MVQYKEIDGTEYPFFFSFRAVFSFMNGKNLESLQDVDREINFEYDSLLKLFEEASKKGAKEEDSDKKLTMEEIEDHIDKDPKLFMELNEMFEESKVIKVFTEEDDSEKK